MLKCRRALIYISLLAIVPAAGCRAPPLPYIDQAVADYASRPFDEAPAAEKKPAAQLPSDDAAPATETQPDSVIRFSRDGGAIPDQDKRPLRKIELVSGQVDEELPTGRPKGPLPSRFELTIPKRVPGSEAPLVKLPREPNARQEGISQLYPRLPPVVEEPVPLPGPDGRPFTLADLQRLAAANSPTLRQAVADVEAARGLLIQARTYVNPTTGVEVSPNANNTASSTWGMFVDQTIITGGKLKLAAASAQMDLNNAELALRRARSDLATQVRTAYYNLLVARETVRVNKSLAHYSVEIYRLQADLLAGGFAAPHEPAALRSQLFVVRLAYNQAVTAYVYAWKQLVAAVGLRQLPFSAVEGEVDRLIPNYDYDALVAHVLRNHTDVLTARNTLAGARYDLKLAQITPVGDIDVRADLFKESQIWPRQNYHQLSIGIPLAIWDRNKGNIRAATAGLVRAAEGPHQVELALTSGLAGAYGPYKENLAAVEYYRRNILPDQVRYYRGVLERRQIDPAAAFADLVQAQQTLVADVSAYLGILGQLWTSVVGVADFIQTDDLYQFARPLELAPLPDLDVLPALPCPHPLGEVSPDKAKHHGAARGYLRPAQSGQRKGTSHKSSPRLDGTVDAEGVNPSDGTGDGTGRKPGRGDVIDERPARQSTRLESEVSP